MSNEQQLTIFRSGEGIELPVDPAGVSTGERLRAQRPELYDLVVNGLAEGMSTRALSRATGVHHRTIAAVRNGSDHVGSIAAAKEEVKRNLCEFIRLTSERAVEEYDKIPIASLLINHGIAVDKLLLLDGAPTSIVEVRHGPTHEDLNSWYLKQLQSASIPVVEVGNVDNKDGLKVSVEESGTDGVSIVSDGDHERGDVE